MRVRQQTPKIGIAVLALLALGVGWLAFSALTRDVTPPKSAVAVDAVERTADEESDYPDKPDVASLETALNRLGDPAERFTILILGDSTGISEKGWQRLITAWLGETTDRDVVYHQWFTNEEPNDYYAPFTQVDGDSSKAPIEVWNTSAGGQSFAYQIENADRQLAEVQDVDLIIVNHGHNISPASSYYSEGVPFLTELLDRWPDSSMILTKQNPEKPGTGRNSILRNSVFGYIDAFAASRDIPTLDVYSAFEATGEPLKLIDSTLFHPKPKGYALWFEELRDMLAPHVPSA